MTSCVPSSEKWSLAISDKLGIESSRKLNMRLKFALTKHSEVHWSRWIKWSARDQHYFSCHRVCALFFTTYHWRLVLHHWCFTWMKIFFSRFRVNLEISNSKLEYLKLTFSLGFSAEDVNGFAPEETSQFIAEIIWLIWFELTEI